MNSGYEEKKLKYFYIHKETLQNEITQVIHLISCSQIKKVKSGFVFTKGVFCQLQICSFL